jgi:hypothetical protein
VVKSIGIQGKDIHTDDIPMDDFVVGVLRSIRDQ